MSAQDGDKAEIDPKEGPSRRVVPSGNFRQMNETGRPSGLAAGLEVLGEQFHSFSVVDLMHFPGLFIVEYSVGVPFAAEPRHHHSNPCRVKSFLRQRPSHDLGWSRPLDVSGEEPVLFELFESSSQYFRGNSVERFE